MRWSLIIALASAGLGAAVAQEHPMQSLPNLFPVADSAGFVETYNTNGTPIDLTGPFFQSLGSNGRSCSSCHRPAEAWSVSAYEVQLRFLLTQGLDPIFRTNDGSNCDHNIDVSTLEGRRSAYSLLTSRGLLRIALPVPVNAEFTVVSVRNPYGCNDPSTVSVYRRPLPATNLRFLSAVMFDGRESSPQTGTQKITYATNPADLLADLFHQAMDATTGHAQAAVPPSPQQVQAIVDFEMQLRTAQAIDFSAGVLNADSANGGAVAIAGQPFFIGINDSFPPNFHLNPSGTPFTPAIFDLFDAWIDSQNSRRASIARGQAVFNSKPIHITGVAGINDVLEVESLPGTCGTCHDSPNIGDHSFPAPLNIGVGDLTSPLDLSYLPAGDHTSQQRNRCDGPDDRPRARSNYGTLGGYWQGQGAGSAGACRARTVLPQRLGRHSERYRDVLRRAVPCRLHRSGEGRPDRVSQQPVKLSLEGHGYHLQSQQS